MLQEPLLHTSDAIVGRRIVVSNRKLSSNESVSKENLAWGRSSVVERLPCKHEVPGSILGVSTFAELRFQLTSFFGAPKSLQMVITAMKLRLLLLGRRVMTNLDSILKSRGITLPP